MGLDLRSFGVRAMTRGGGIALFANFRGTRVSLFTFRIFFASRLFVEGLKIFYVDFTRGFSILVDNLIHVWQILELVLRLRPVRRTKKYDIASRLCRPGYSALRGVTHYSSVLVAFALLRRYPQLFAAHLVARKWGSGLSP